MTTKKKPVKRKEFVTVEVKSDGKGCVTFKKPVKRKTAKKETPEQWAERVWQETKEKPYHHLNELAGKPAEVVVEKPSDTEISLMRFNQHVRGNT